MAKKYDCTNDYISFDRVIDLQTPVVSRDTFGAEILTWTSDIIPASIEPQNNSQEDVGSSKKRAFTTINFIIRWRNLLHEKQKIVFEGNEYDIIGITEVPRRKYTRINAVFIR